MRKLLFISACLLSAVTYGQSSKFTFKLGDEYELPRKTEDLAFFGNPSDGIINLSLKKEELNVLRFDPISLAQTDDKIINLPEATKNFNSETVTDFRNGNYYWIHSDWDKESGKEYLYYDKINVSSAKFTSQNNKMIEATKIAGVSENTKNGPPRGFGGLGKAFDFKVVNKYKYDYSADHKLLLVSYRLIPEDRNDKVNHDKIGLVVFDDNMNKVWSNEFTMPYTEAIMDNSDFSIDSKGNAYLLAKVYNDDHRREKDKETGKADYNYEVLKFTKDSKEILHSPVGIGDFFIKDASLVESTTNDMVVACTYSKKAKGDKTDGIFLAILNKDGKVVKYKNGYYEFPVADLEKFESERQQRKMEKKDDYEAPNLEVRDIVIQGDGSIFITSEEYFVYSKSSSDGQGNTYYYNEYHYENIIAARIKASGEFDWVRKVPKRQMGISGTNTLGFQLIADSSGYYFLYNDLKKNLELADDEAPKYYKEGGKGDVIVSRLDNRGNLTKSVLFDTKEEEVQIHPKEFTRLNGNHLIGRAIVKKNRYKPLLITIN